MFAAATAIAAENRPSATLQRMNPFATAVVRNGEFVRIWDEQTNPSAKPETMSESELRAYVKQHPDDWKATRRLLSLVDTGEAESILDPLLKAKPNDPDLYAARADVRSRAGRMPAAIEDYKKAADLDPHNAERRYVLGVAYYEQVSKNTALTDAQKREYILRGTEALQRAESLKPGYFEAMVYRNLFLRQKAQLETDPAVRTKLIAEADALRDQAVEIVKERRHVASPAPERPKAPPSTAPVQVSGDVHAPVILSRVDPVYTDDMRKNAVSGIAIVELIVDKSGRVSRANVIKPVPHGGSEAALAAVKQWTFKPGTLNGEPVDVIYNVTVRIAP